MKKLKSEKNTKANDTITRTIRISGDTFDKITELAEKNGLSFNSVVNQIIEYGLENIQDVLDEYKQYKEYTNLEIQCMDLIKAFMPEYSYEEMEEWTWGKLMYMTVRAERIATLKGFDWHIEDQSEAYMQEVNKITMDNKDFIKSLQENGIDPMYYFSEELKDTFKRDILDFPLIGGIHWNDEVVLSVIREQIRKADYRNF